jgi:redox-sensitive bicupin YhaK (pirin superfamily)
METRNTLSERSLQRVIEGMATSDGAGVKLRRSLGRGPGTRLDPFLMLDEFSSDNPDDYNAGFPSHPHRGFETVTYILDGHMRHEDHLGNRGDLQSGGVQWMTAGRGIIHSEMPMQTQGRMRGFQLLVNLPAKEKMKSAGYRDIPAGDIPAMDLPGEGRVKVIAGQLRTAGRELRGAVVGLTTDPLYLDVVLPAGASFSAELESDYHAFVYPYEGGVTIGEGGAARPLKLQHAGILSEGERLTVNAAGQEARFLILAGRPLNEPIAQYGPFVMNTAEEIEQAIRDYQAGTLTAA